MYIPTLSTCRHFCSARLGSARLGSPTAQSVYLSVCLSIFICLYLSVSQSVSQSDIDIDIYLVRRVVPGGVRGEFVPVL